MSARIEGIVARLHGLHPRLIDLTLDRLLDLLAKLDHPERRLPPVVHVAGTNGKGSTCAFVRAMAEAAGQRVHVYTSPHLVRFNERIRLAGELVTDDALTAALEHVERVNAGAAITVFEVITAVAFHLFAQTQADLCVLEVGLGGRGDATNVIDKPGCLRDHLHLARSSRNARRHAAAYRSGEGRHHEAGRAGGDRRAAGRGSRCAAEGCRRRRRAGDAARPRLACRRGSLQRCAWHSGSAAAIVAWRVSARQRRYRHCRDACVRTADECARGIAAAEWPARLQRLHGRLAALLPADWELWLDGGHNPGAGIVLAEHLRTWSDRPAHLVVGMKQTKDAAEFLRPLIASATTLWAVAEPGQHDARPVEVIVEASGGVARPGPPVADALRALPRDGRARVLICGSLYLAGEVLKLDG